MLPSVSRFLLSFYTTKIRTPKMGFLFFPAHLIGTDFSTMLRWWTSCYWFKGTVKCTNWRKSGAHCDFRHTFSGRTKQFLCPWNPLLIQIFIECHIHTLLKNPCKMELGKSTEFCHLFQRKRFLIVLINIITGTHNRFHIFLFLFRIIFCAQNLIFILSTSAYNISSDMYKYLI